MIPLRDSTPGEHFPIITVVLIILNSLIFFYETTLGHEGLDQFAYIFGMVPAYYTNHQVPLIGYLPFITSLFLHGSLMHLVGNMWILWLFGDNVEDKMGPVRFLGFYLLCGILAGVAHYIFNINSQIPIIGASGAVAGVMGAYFLMFRKARVLTYVFPIFLLNLPAWIFLGFWALSQLYAGAAGLLAVGSQQDVAFWAHVGGFAMGMALFKQFLRKPVMT
ncbi:MAG: rhomboid family intramembrane serine protease [Syntrophomonadaceae bacterium]|nr:rhomboid family intramembrane serine protease [Syntrophomonadaceae bacterium]